MIKTKKKGQAIIIVVLLLVIAVLVLVYPLGRGKDIDKVKDKINKLQCPDVDTNISCEHGIRLYKNDRGCTFAECKTPETPSTLPESSTQVFFVDVRQGDGIYIETPQEKHIVIDCGTGDYMSDFLTFRGIKKIDWLITTHPDADHIGGCDEILENMVVLNFMRPELKCETDTCQALERVASEEEGMIEHYGYAGFNLEEYLDLNWAIISPNPDLEFDNKNDNSLVIKMWDKNVEFLFTGDCGEECEEMIFLLDKEVSSDILKVGHHGSKTSTSAQFLTMVNPAYAVLSYGDTNPYGHPAKEVLDRLVRQNIQIVRTASAGDIEVRTNGKELEWYCEKKTNCFE